MNKRILLPISILLVCLLLASCGFQSVSGSGKVIAETRDISGFTAVTLEGIGEVTIEQGTRESLTIEAEDNLIEYFDITVKNSTLIIGIKDEYQTVSLQPTQPVKFQVTVRDLEAVTLAGSGSITTGDLETTNFDISLLGSGHITTGNLTTEAVTINLAGSGNISIGKVTANSLSSSTLGSGGITIEKLTADSVDVSIPGSGDLTLTGTVGDQQIDIRGSGSYEASGLQSESATISIAGSGDVFLAVSDSLNVDILGSGDVTYSGQPTVETNIAGSGDVSRVEP